MQKISNMNSPQMPNMNQMPMGRGMPNMGRSPMGMNNSPMHNMGKKVGASVAVEGATPLGYGGWGGNNWGGCPNPCNNPCGGFPYGGAFPYPGFYPYPPNILIDNRDRFPIVRPSVTATILAGQAVAGGATQQVQLSGITASTGGASLSGNSLLLPRIGTYIINLNATVFRDITSPSGVVSFSVIGGTSGTVTITSNTVASGDTVTFSGSTVIQVTAPNAVVSFNVANTTLGAGSISITGGTVSAQFIA